MRRAPSPPLSRGRDGGVKHDDKPRAEKRLAEAITSRENMTTPLGVAAQGRAGH
jgi:hypothetical protein